MPKKKTESEYFDLPDAYDALMEVLKVQIDVLRLYPNTPHTEENQARVHTTLSLMRETLQLTKDF